MPPHVRGPVQIQAPVAVPDGALWKGASGGHMPSVGARQTGRRRIFVQIDTGNVVGIEVDRADKVESVKKKVQEALCVPTENSALTFGDHILEKDLSVVTHDSPLLLTRGSLRRSSSTPCLSPTVRDGPPKPKFGNHAFEIVGGKSVSSRIKNLLRETIKAIENGIQPYPASGGLGGAYYFRNRKGENAAIVKPTDEEPFAPNNPKGFVGKILGQPGLKRSIRVGETGVREVAAYLLDHDHFAQVPATVLVKAVHPIFNVNADASKVASPVPVAKICSYQQYAKHDYDASEHGTSRFPVSEVHRIGILDVRILNTDRHAGNILVRKLVGEEARGAESTTWGRTRLLGDESVTLVPIDHGLCLPETLEDPYFEWLHWPQASIPFSEEELLYIAALDPLKEVEMLKKELSRALRDSCLQILVICTVFLQRGAAAGLTLAEIGGMMSRELCGMEEEPSKLESVCMLACKLEREYLLEDELSPAGSFDEPSFEGDFNIDQDEQFQVDDIHEDAEPWSVVRENLSSLSLHSPVHYRGGICSPVSVIGGLSGGFQFSVSPMSSPRVGSFRKGMSGVLEMERVDEDADCPSPMSTPKGRCYKTPPPPYENKNFMPSASLTGGGAYMPRHLGAPPRSVSLNSQKHRYHNQYEARRVIGLRGAASAFEMTRKSTEGGPSTLELPAMESKAWPRFLSLFEELLPEVFAERKVENESGLQRLGTSCQF